MLRESPKKLKKKIGIIQPILQQIKELVTIYCYELTEEHLPWHAGIKLKNLYLSIRFLVFTVKLHIYRLV